MGHSWKLVVKVLREVTECELSYRNDGQKQRRAHLSEVYDADPHRSHRIKVVIEKGTKRDGSCKTTVSKQTGHHHHLGGLETDSWIPAPNMITVK